MSKKRKTRKEKENAKRRKAHILIHAKAIPEVSAIPVYSIEKIKTPEVKTIKKNNLENKSDENKEKSYLIHDFQLILGASGIVVAFDIVLFLLLSRGIVRLPLLGY